MDRVILHSDANCFYASVEMLHHPEYDGLPLAVGGDAEKRHGIILTANYIAKRRGVKTGSALWEARQACPGLIIVPPNYDQYIRFSGYLREIYSKYSDRVESFGLDESWIDATHSAGIRGDGLSIANEISRDVKNELGLTVSIGVSWNKIFAKFGSDYKKPDAITVIDRENYRRIVWTKPAEDLLYVGRATKRKLANVGIRTIGQIAEADPDYLQGMLGKHGLMLSIFAHGEDKTPVAKENTDAPMKSIGNGMTMPRDLVNDMEVKMAFYMLSETVATRLRENHFAGNIIEIYVRDNDLMGFTRHHKIPVPTNISDEIARNAMALFLANYRWHKPIRGVGVRVAGLKGENYPYQLDLFNSEERREKQLAADRAVDEIRKRFGTAAVQRGLMYFGPDITPRKRQEQTIHPHSYLERGNLTMG